MKRADVQSIFSFKYLPGYAGYILSEKFTEYVAIFSEITNNSGLPLLKFFNGMSKEATDELAAENSHRFLTALKNQDYENFIDHGIRFWIDNQLPVISKEQIAAGDIGLINYCRRQTLMTLVPCFTREINIVMEICREADFFLTQNEAALITTLIDIQREQLSLANAALTERENQLLEAQRIAHIGSFEWDLTGNDKSTVTPEVHNILGVNHTNDLESFIEGVYIDDRQKLKDAISNAMASGIYECEYRYIHDHSLKYIWSRGVVYYENNIPVKLVGTIADNTEKSILIEKLLESEELNKQSQALTNTGSWKWIMDDQLIEWSDEMYRIYGLSPQSEKITFERFVSFIHPQDRERRINEISIAIETGATSDYHMKIINPDGTEKVLRGKGKVLLDKNGKALGMVGTCQDITMEYGLSVELLRKNDELIEKNKELESFNFIASHDLQEPLRKIQLYSSRIKAENDKLLTENISLNLCRITNAAESLQVLINDFLYFSQYIHIGEVQSAIDLNLIVERIIHEYETQITESGMTISLQSLPEIPASLEQIYRAFRSIISNAIKFQHPGRKPELKILSEVAESNGNSYHNIRFIDNGIGFESKYKDRIFEPFQRLYTKEEFPGSGIGLSICKKIIEDHNGFIKVETHPGVGSAFNIYLPRNN
jgi:signal transduction histidine kinase